MSQNIWKFKYIKKYYQDLQVLSTFAHSQKGCAGQGKLQGPQHSKSPALVTLPFMPGQEEPRGAVCDCPCAGLLVLPHPDLSVSLCQHRILHQQGINPVLSGAQPQLPPPAAALGFIA